MSAEEREAFAVFVAANPCMGEIMPGTGGARKVRYRQPGTGKSGGYRVITYFAGDELPVFLLGVFTKGEKANLSQGEWNALRVVLAGLVQDYQEGVSRYVKGRRSDPSGRS